MPVVYHWPLVKAFLPFVPALILLPFLLPRPNRKAEAWLVLVPFGLIAAAVEGGQLIGTGRVGLAFTYSLPFINMLASSLGIASLMTHAISAWPLLKKMLLLPALSVLPGAIALAVTRGVAGAEDLILIISYSVVVLVLLLSATLTGRLCRRRWRLLRFSVLFFMWNLILTILLLGAIAALELILYPVAAIAVLPVIVAFLMLSLLLTVVAYPFVLMEFLSPFYRARLEAAFKVVKQAATL